MDYYGILELKRSANDQEIFEAYHRLSLKYYPNKDALDFSYTNHRFHQIAEAYDVLVDPMKKAIYDEFGEKGLKYGVEGKIDKASGYKYAGNAYAIFENFFSGSDQISLEPSSFSELKVKCRGVPKDIVVEVECTLEEMYLGCMKTVTYEREKLGLDGKSVRKHREEMQVQIHPGQGKKSNIRFEHKGNETYSYPTSDLVIKIQELQHPQYKRKDDDLIYIHKISLINALSALPFEIETLDHRIIPIVVEQVLTPQTKQVVPGEGMPVAGTKGKQKGNLFILFDIVFPTFLSEEKQKQLKDLLL